jgi:hypothetical protein
MMFTISQIKFFLSFKGLSHSISEKESNLNPEAKLRNLQNKKINLFMSKYKLFKKEKDLVRHNSSEEEPETFKHLLKPKDQ